MGNQSPSFYTCAWLTRELAQLMLRLLMSAMSSCPIYSLWLPTARCCLSRSGGGGSLSGGGWSSNTPAKDTVLALYVIMPVPGRALVMGQSHRCSGEAKRAAWAALLVKKGSRGACGTKVQNHPHREARADPLPGDSAVSVMRALSVQHRGVMWHSLDSDRPAKPSTPCLPNHKVCNTLAAKPGKKS